MATVERYTVRRGEMTWFNVCLRMFVRQELFNALLGSAVENPAVTVIQFVLNAEERPMWETAVVPKLAAWSGREKVREPRGNRMTWHELGGRLQWR